MQVSVYFTQIVALQIVVTIEWKHLWGAKSQNV